MADKLVVEFYENEDQFEPVAVILSLHGGDNPASASLTLSDFIATTRANKSAQTDAYGLASQFMVWANKWGQLQQDSLASEAELIPKAKKYSYQTARVFVDSQRIRVQLVEDEFTSGREFIEGNDLLRTLSLL